MNRWLAAPLVMAAAATLAACSFSTSVGNTSVSKDDVQKQISEKVTEQGGTKPDSVTCPSDLKAEVGATLDCKMSDGKKNYGVNVTVTSVDGKTVNFDIVQTVDKDAVAEQISEQLTQQVGRAPESVTCPSDLKGDKGATLQCELTDSGETYGVTVTVTSVKGGDVKFDFKVDDQPK
ncbi:DUF4333 domain-containing protein [Mycolicibacterium fluoranthenivorans]|uniref:DUF4333 domain-containing protein n=1 Tax=Mycolicibacterium fluoranthenivorans TaxID=258505 RepID=A0A7G8PC11_9MYCO|nr:MULTISPECIES: DUF4333 domain-containing protein [Mycobacteriaceae]MCV7255199.1 DUF4333 domain-containing protein [Mycobacterium hackensackense]QNJ91877.1 DUF4333 domain-containing protein [Mycolicibacterium fluoranthenivorans]